MANLVYNSLFEKLMNGEIDFDTDTIKIALLKDTYSPDAAHDTWADIKADQVTGVTGYNNTAGGSALAGVTIADKKLDATNPVWTITGTLTCAYAVIYKYIDDAGSPDDTSPLVCLLDLGGNKSVTDGNFTIEFHANGIITWSQIS